MPDDLYSSGDLKLKLYCKDQVHVALNRSDLLLPISCYIEDYSLKLSVKVSNCGTRIIDKVHPIATVSNNK